jgi:hypothetical protein
VQWFFNHNQWPGDSGRKSEFADIAIELDGTDELCKRVTADSNEHSEHELVTAKSDAIEFEDALVDSIVRNKR